MQTGKKSGLIIMVSPHVDIYFDMINFGLKSSPTTGVTDAIIKAYDLIIQGDKPTMKKTEIKAINVYDNTEKAFVHLTNNMTSFKVRNETIDGKTIKKGTTPITVDIH